MSQARAAGSAAAAVVIEVGGIEQVVERSLLDRDHAAPSSPPNYLKLFRNLQRPRHGSNV